MLLLEVNDHSIISSVITKAAILCSIGNFIILLFMNKKINDIVNSFPGLLGKKELADRAAGAKDERDAREKQIAAENAGKLFAYQQHKDAVSEVKSVKREIVEAVEEKADETQEVVKEIPERVVKKLSDEKKPTQT